MVRRIFLVLAVVALMVATTMMGASAAFAKPKVAKAKVPICHNIPNNPHTIVVAPSAVPAHLAHGDLPGVCPTPLPTV